MRLKVDLLPRGPYQGVVLLVDVLRATTTAPLLFSRGLGSLFMTPSIKTARAFASTHNFTLIGERDGLPPEGFQYGASPSDLVRLNFAGKTAVLTTQNGPKTVGFVAAAGAKTILLASFYNAAAATQAALDLALAQGHEEIAIVCAGQMGAESLDDAVVAGFLARLIERKYANLRNVDENLPVLEFRDAALMAMALLRAFPDPQEALMQSAAGVLLARHRLHEDIAFASLISQTTCVPRLVETIEHLPEPLYRFLNHQQSP